MCSRVIFTSPFGKYNSIPRGYRILRSVNAFLTNGQRMLHYEPRNFEARSNKLFLFLHPLIANIQCA